MNVKRNDFSGGGDVGGGGMGLHNREPFGWGCS